MKILSNVEYAKLVEKSEQVYRWKVLYEQVRLEARCKGTLVRDASVQHIQARCPECSAPIVDQFPREKGFTLICEKCGFKITGVVAGFDEDAKVLFRKVEIRKYDMERRKKLIIDRFYEDFREICKEYM